MKQLGLQRFQVVILLTKLPWRLIMVLFEQRVKMAKAFDADFGRNIDNPPIGRCKHVGSDRHPKLIDISGRGLVQMFAHRPR